MPSCLDEITKLTTPRRNCKKQKLCNITICVIEEQCQLLKDIHIEYLLRINSH